MRGAKVNRGGTTGRGQGNRVRRGAKGSWSRKGDRRGKDRMRQRYRMREKKTEVSLEK